MFNFTSRNVCIEYINAAIQRNTGILPGCAAICVVAWHTAQGVSFYQERTFSELLKVTEIMGAKVSMC